MQVRLGKLYISFTWNKTPIFRTVYLQGFDAGRVYSLFEVGFEDTAGGKIYFFGVGRFTAHCKWLDRSYKPKYWIEQEALLKKMANDLEAAGHKVPPPPKAPNVVPFGPRNPNLH